MAYLPRLHGSFIYKEVSTHTLMIINVSKYARELLMYQNMHETCVCLQASSLNITRNVLNSHFTIS